MEANTYLNKVYGGLLGKCVGVRLGAPVEPTIWSYERIRKSYGDITGYVKNYKNFAADDDVNGPLFFIRALLDHPAPITPQKIGQTWLNYTREGIGFYWWGGYGRSTEHTAYLNLKSGIEAPLSGSIEVNGSTVAEQIGGQIFIDSWGWVFPDNPEEAARYAGMAASVGHDRNGIYGGIFIAVCISLAFVNDNIEEIIEKALTFIPEDSEYARVVKAVREFHADHPDNWRDARDFLGDNFGYDKYPGVCHMIPNAGVCALALYYAQGNFARTVEIATMCGWDTDCNAGNVGAIIGVMNGPESIPEHYLRPLNDFHAASSISGALNIIDLPTASKELAVLGLKQRGDVVPDAWKPGVFSDDIYLDFSLPKSTCGIRTSSDFLAPVAPGEELKEQDKLSIVLDRMVRGDTARIFYKPYYRRDDFDDERYSPTFTPLVYPGQILKINGSVERMSGQRIAIAPYVRDAESKEIISDGYTFPVIGEDFSIEWELPQVDFAIDEAGLLVTNFDSEKYLGHLYLHDYSITGKRKFSIQFCEEQHEFKGLTRCSAVGGAWELENNGLRVITMDNFHLYSGPYYTKDSIAECVVVPEYGESHLLVVRSRGAESGYYFGLHGNGKAVLLKRDHTLTVLKEIDYPWEMNKSVSLEVAARGNILTCKIDEVEVLEYTDSDALPSGMAGIAKLSQGRSLFMSLRAEEV
ncbi:MAG: ADP-ribosylglycohydrolase family protein [Bacteroidetes bacterium]|nr:ADP-ribosylglycohydrolase family protein [Bacteroidota bacterium]